MESVSVWVLAQCFGSAKTVEGNERMYSITLSIEQPFDVPALDCAMELGLDGVERDLCGSLRKKSGTWRGGRVGNREPRPS